MGFGDFDFLCKKAPVPLCLLVGPYDDDIGSGLSATGVMPKCYARSIELANTMIFQVGSDFIHIAAIIVLLIIIFNIRGKYTAIGRTEILDFFYLFIVQTVLSLVIDAGVTPPGSGSYAYFVAVQAGIASALCCCLMVNGFLGFQLYEDGTKTSVWSLRIASVCAFALTFVIALFTFQGWGGDSLSPTNTTALFVVMYILNAVFVLIYIGSQLVLSIFILRDVWPVGAIGLGVFFFVAGQVLFNALSDTVCINVKHYVDGTFFGTLCTLFTVMMVYKYWDMITKEDLEFSVSNKENAWEVKELLDDDRRYDNGSEYASSTYGLNSHPF
jgi:hypothetical protein